MVNILDAVVNLVSNQQRHVINENTWHNRMNNVGEGLEKYIQNLFITNTEANPFSYLWNQNNPPDIILKWGDAIEVKKIEWTRNQIALNSSFPKDYLYSDDTRITDTCIHCEDEIWWWTSKDMIYCIWTVNESVLKRIWFVYWNCYAANKQTYMRIFNWISNWITQIPWIEFEETNELAKVKKVDPLWITSLRVRGMWHIEHPTKLFWNYVNNENSNFIMKVILLKEKYNSFPENSRNIIENLNIHNFYIQDIMIKNPNNPARFLEAKLLSYEE